MSDSKGGRPTLHGTRMVRVTVYVTEAQLATITAVGWSSPSLGVRRCIDDVPGELVASWTRSNPAAWRDEPAPREKHQ